MDIEVMWTKITELSVELAPKLLLVIITWIVGSIVIKNLPMS